jgi:ABC-type glycerol-3-phosphate transport system permease component
MHATYKDAKFNKKKIGDRIFAWAITLFMSIFALSFLFIFVWMILNSLRAPANYNANPLKLFDFSGTDSLFENYKEVFDYEVRKSILVNGKRQSVTINVVQMLKNSFIQMSIAVIGGLIFPPAVGYVVAKYDFKLKKIIMVTVVMTMCIPMIGTTAATLKP